MAEGKGPRFGLKEETIDRIRRVFSAHPTVRRVVLYGSRAKGIFEPGSDIDLTLHGEDLTAQELLSIDRELDDLLLPYKIDLSLYDQIRSEDLLDHIARVGQEFYSNCEGAENAEEMR